MNLNYHIKKIRTNGLTIIEDFYTSKHCDNLIKISEEIIANKLIKKKNKISNTCQIINSPFQFNKIFYKSIFQTEIDKLLRKIIDDDYVLINSNIINRKKSTKFSSKGITIGETWHTDTRYVGNKKLPKGFSYIVFTMLSDFTKENGATEYVPGSHHLESRPKRYKNYKKKLITGKKGSLAIFDTSLWHRGGKPSNIDRWSIYSYYGPWFMKPYFRFPDMLKNKKQEINKSLKKILHFNSTPPLNDDERLHTLTK